MKYGKLTFIKECGVSKDGHILWECLCDCNEIYIGYASKIRNEKIIGCKVCSIKSGANKIKTHGMKGSIEYSSWTAMKDRCLNKKSKDYPKYGAVGINIYQEWIDSFESFFAYMGKKEYGQSIDRIDNLKGYFPNNVRWANNSEQQRNKQCSIHVDWNGIKTHINDIALELGITRGAAFMRYKRGKLYGK